MLPKIIICADIDQTLIREKLSLTIESEVSFDAVEANVKDFRSWINFAMSVVLSHPKMSIVVWNAQTLTEECQSILLKPLEEKDDKINFYLVVSKLGAILPTVVSRSDVVKLDVDGSEDLLWTKVASCWRGTEADCLLLAQKYEKREDVVKILESVISKLGVEIKKKTNKTRLKILNLAFNYLGELQSSNVSPRLCLESFLFSSLAVTKKFKG